MTTIIRRKKLGRSSCKGIAQFSETGIRAIRNDKELPEDDLYIRWGCTTNVPTRRVLNTSEAIHRVNDKAGFRMLCAEVGLAPKTWLSAQDQRKDVGLDAPDCSNWDFPSPCIVRPKRHAQGKHVYLCKTPLQVLGAITSFPGDYYISNFIPKVSEYRVFVVQGRVACVAEKTPGNPDDVAWNVAKGGRFDVVSWDNWPLKACRISIEAFLLSGLDFGGVDVMIDAEGGCYVLEINSAPSLTSPYRQECMAKCFDYIVNNSKAIIPLIEAKGGYKKFIHPAVCGRAQLVDNLEGLVPLQGIGVEDVRWQLGA